MNKPLLKFEEWPWPKEEGRKTRRFKVLNNYGQALGLILYRNTWRRYIFRSQNFSIDLDGSCMREIIEQLDSLNLDITARLEHTS